MVGFVVGNLLEGVVDRLASVPMGFLNLGFFPNNILFYNNS